MKSSGGDYKEPKSPAPPAGMIYPQGQTAVAAPPQVSFLPSDPTAMATGLTPEMMAAIETPPPMQQPAQQSGMQEDEMRMMLARLMAGQQPSIGDRWLQLLNPFGNRGRLGGGVGRGGSGGGYSTSGRGAGGNASSSRGGGFGGF